MLARFLRALDVPAGRVPADTEAAAVLYRTLLADHRMLVFLDNAQSADQVRPLLPGGGQNLVLITSRNDVSGLVTREGATRLSIGVLSAGDALELLEGMLGRARVAAEREAAAELARLCAYLPLALRIAATALHGQPHRLIEDYAARLRPDPLRELVVHGEPDLAVQSAFDISYTALPVRARRLLRRCGLLPGPDFTIESAAVAAELDRDEASEILDLLTRAHLVEQRTPGRFSCHDLLRLYAARRAEQEEPAQQRATVVANSHNHHLSTAHRGTLLLPPNGFDSPSPRPTGSPR